jgi:nitrogen regulatory protein PII
VSSTLQLVVIVAESVLEREIVETVKEAGAKGYTITEARGEGSRGVRATEWEGSNLRLETVVTEPVAETILEAVAERYFAHYAVIAWRHAVSVERGLKYGQPEDPDAD